MSNFAKLYKKVGGKEILRQYRRAHVLCFALFQALMLGFSKKSLEIVRLAVENKIVCKLRKKYKKKIVQFKEKIDKEYETLPHERCNKVWFCWYQGLDNAPLVVRKCYQSLKDNLIDREIIVITEENYLDYVDFPDFIIEKYKKGIISKTHFSDLLRLQLLIRYGGTWIDSTVYCSGGNIPQYMLDSNLFLFQNLKPGLDGHATSISNWFITACQNEKILVLVRDLLFEFWEKHKLIDYFIFHDFMQLAIEAYSYEWQRVVPFANSVPHILLLRLFEPFDKDFWGALNQQTPFHKLTYKFNEDSENTVRTYYNVIIKENDGCHD